MEQLAELQACGGDTNTSSDNADDWVSQAQDNNPLVRGAAIFTKGRAIPLPRRRPGICGRSILLHHPDRNYSSGNVTMPVGYESRIKSM